jgi:hypothetical protein
MSFDLSYCPDTVYVLEPNAGRVVATAMVMMFIVGMVFGGSVILWGDACGAWIKNKIVDWENTL